MTDSKIAIGLNQIADDLQKIIDDPDGLNQVTRKQNGGFQDRIRGYAAELERVTCVGRENDYVDSDTPVERLRKIAANLTCYSRREDVDVTTEAHGFALEAMDQYADHIRSVIVDLESERAGTHAFDLVAEHEKRHVETTSTLVQMVAATVLAKLVDEEGGGRTNITFGPPDMDKMMSEYEMSATVDGLLTTVRIEPRNPDEYVRHRLALQPEVTSDAAPQVEATDTPKPYYFFKDGSGRQGPMEKADAEALVLKSVDPIATAENRTCPYRGCTGSDSARPPCALCYE